MVSWLIWLCSLWSEICRTLTIQVGCTRARTIKNHQNAFLLRAPAAPYKQKSNNVWKTDEALMLCPKSHINMCVLTPQGNALLWSRFVLGWAQFNANSNFGSSDHGLLANGPLLTQTSFGLIAMATDTGIPLVHLREKCPNTLVIFLPIFYEWKWKIILPKSLKSWSNSGILKPDLLFSPYLIGTYQFLHIASRNSGPFNVVP